MKNFLFIFILPLLFSTELLHAQLERVILETYYISDADDATDTAGGHLEVGSITYRIYVDMKPGYKLKKVYGNTNHTFKITSTAHFFNNKDRPASFGKDIQSNRLDENTVALDTWLTLGQAAKGSPNYFGVLKRQDATGSVIGGINNDGGSAGITSGLLKNTDAAMSIPLTTADGMIASANTVSNWVDYGIVDFLSGNDSTIFGSIVIDSQFVSNDIRIQSTGVAGPNLDSNQVLIAQLTTKGELAFELNLEILDADGNSTYYVADTSIAGALQPNEKLSRYLKYPFHLICGCPNQNYLEYNPDRDCDNLDSCKTPVILGCMDPLACNYDPNANFSVPGLCCYPGLCQDRDPAVICQVIAGINTINSGFEFNLFPNPAHNQINIQLSSNSNETVVYELYDDSGKLLLNKNVGAVSGTVIEQLDIEAYDSGLYLIRMYIGTTSVAKKFIKE